ncbi:protein of unknown function [Methylacidimicrobium sp. AP8]|nr:protein of unknown function [Methylacidimicrobium sp. AP8]
MRPSCSQCGTTFLQNFLPQPWSRRQKGRFSPNTGRQAEEAQAYLADGQPVSIAFRHLILSRQG